ncbi:hypothetical protein Tco_1056969 [Tanacetum coccineum]|uniref:Uncharacterized protein n=1 Tax=Tanacetum coccineum TaxID=301880 RepID=A0ABQ5H5Y0_9ASTR
MFGDDETIAQVLLNMSQAKAVSREKEKRVELKDVEETERPRPTSTRSLLTLKPLPKIDPKDKGKKKIEEEDESDTESEGIPEAEKKFKQLARDEEMARKVQEDWEAEEEVKKLAEEEAIKTALSNNFTIVSPTEDERRIKEMNEGVKDPNQKSLQKRVVEETPKTEDTAKVPAKVDVIELDKVSSPYRDYLVIYRANGNFRAFNYLLEILHVFDRQDLFHLYDLVMEQYSEVTLEGIELILWGDLKFMMEILTRNENDKVIFWVDQQDWGDCSLGEFERESYAALDLIRLIEQKRLMRIDEVNGDKKGLSVV